MNESQIAREWFQMGKLDARREDLIVVLNIKFTGKVTQEIIDIINHERDFGELGSWLRIALFSGTLDEFLTFIPAKPSFVAAAKLS